MNDEQQPESPGKQASDPNSQPLPPRAPADEKKKPKPDRPPRKRGPSVDIGPSIGPGADVVATPPRRI